MAKCADNFLFGLFFGIGFVVANNVLTLVAALIKGH